MSFPGESHAEASTTETVRRVTRPDGAEIVLSWDEHGAMRYDLVRDAKIIETEIETFHLHPTPRADFEIMLAEAGLANIRALWPYTETPARENAPFAVYLCDKALDLGAEGGDPAIAGQAS